MPALLVPGCGTRSPVTREVLLVQAWPYLLALLRAAARIPTSPLCPPRLAESGAQFLIRGVGSV